MKIILLQSVRGLGDPGDIINVKSGYARNYLFPKKIAQIATDANVKSLESWLKQEEIKEAKNRENKELLVKYLNKLTLKFELKAGENEKLFGSVTENDIADRAREWDLDFELDKRSIQLEEAIKIVGATKVSVRLHAEVEVDLEVQVEPTES